MKKFICALLAVLLSVSVLALPAMADSAVGEFGDTDANGKVNSADALNILKMTVGKMAMNYDKMHYYDVNADYKVNASDALEVLRYTVGKVKTFKAYDPFTGTVNLVNNDIYLQKGGTASMGVWCQSPEDFQIFYQANSRDILELNWDSCGWIFNGQCAILNVSALITVTKETVIPVVIFYKDHPSVYEIFNVHLVPEQSEAYSYGTYAGIPDFGDFVKTAPEWVKTEVITSNGVEYFTTSMCYDAKTVLSNGNGDNVYQKYVELLNGKLTLVSEESRSDGYVIRTYKNDKFTIMLWLQEVDGNQKVFVYLQGKASDV